MGDKTPRPDFARAEALGINIKNEDGSMRSSQEIFNDVTAYIEMMSQPPPEVSTTGFKFTGDSLFNYKNEGAWDPASLTQYRQMAGMSNDEAQKQFWEGPIADQRSMIGMMLDMMNGNDVNASYASKITPTEVTVDTTQYGGDNAELKVFVHKPEGDKVRPALVYAHGGGGVWLTPQMYFAVCNRYAVDSDIVVVNVDYRLAPEAKAPKGAVDIAAAIEYVHANAESLGIDKEKIAIGGDSAGAMVTAGAAIHLQKKGLPNLVKLTIAIHPMVADFLSRKENPLTEQGVEKGETYAMKMLYSMITPDDDSCERCFIAPAEMPGDIAKDFPKTVVMLSEFDNLRRGGEEYADMLQKAGRLVDYVVYPGTHHTWHIDMSHATASTLYEDTVKVLDKWLKQ